MGEKELRALNRFPFIYRFSFSFLVCTLFGALFFVFFLLGQDEALKSTAWINPQTLSLFTAYGKFVPIALAFLSFLGVGLLFFLRFLFRLHRSKVIVSVFYIVLFAAWATFWGVLVYQEPRYTDFAIAIIDFFGKPLLYSGGIVAGLSFVWFLAALIDSLFKTGTE